MPAIEIPGIRKRRRKTDICASDRHGGTVCGRAARATRDDDRVTCPPCYRMMNWDIGDYEEHGFDPDSEL